LTSYHHRARHAGRSSRHAGRIDGSDEPDHRPFHVVFILLTLGVFSWDLHGFVLRAGFWLPVTTVVVVEEIVLGRMPAGELSEIPLLSVILLGGFNHPLATVRRAHLGVA
jgi:hypothetical protein